MQNQPEFTKHKVYILNFKYAVFYCSLLAYIVLQIITHLFSVFSIPTLLGQGCILENELM